MRRAPKITSALCAALAAFAACPVGGATEGSHPAAAAAIPGVPRQPAYARWFFPGGIGFEPGLPPPPPSARAFLSRPIGTGPSEAEQAWCRFNHLTTSIQFSHNLSNIVRTEDYAAHPEWFPVVGGLRMRPDRAVYYWNPDLGSEAVLRRAVDVARAAFRGNPQQPSFALGVNDGLVFGESPEILPWIAPTTYFRSRPNYSDLIYRFTNRVAEALAPEFPDRHVGALAYYWCEQVPRIPIHPQVIPFLCADRSQGYDRAFWAEETKLQLAWLAKGTRRFGVYDYLDGFGYLVPRIHIGLISEYLPRLRRIGVTDYYGESSPNWGLEGPQIWLVAQLLSQPEADPVAMIDEYYARYFAESAGPMRRYFELCEAVWMAQPPPADWLKHYRSETQAVLFPSSVCKRLRLLLDEAAVLARSDIVRRRVRFVSEAFALTEKFVAYQEAKTRASLWATRAARMQLPRESGDAAAATVRALRDVIAAKRAFVGHMAALKEEHPLAFHSGNLADYTSTEPIYTAAMAALELGSAGAVGALAAESGEEAVGDALAVWRLRQVHAGAPVGGVSAEASFEGAVLGGRRIAGLQYGADVDGNWQTRVEPVEGVVASVSSEAARSGRGGFRLANVKYLSMYGWHVVPEGTSACEISAQLRGRLSPGARVVFSITWLDGTNQVLSTTAVRHQAVPDSLAPIPEDYRPDVCATETHWVPLRTGQRVPPGAKWVSLSLTVLYQLPGDHLDIDEVALLRW